MTFTCTSYVPISLSSLSLSLSLSFYLSLLFIFSYSLPFVQIFFWLLPVKTGSISITGIIYNLCVLETQSLAALGDVGGPSGGQEKPLCTQGFQGRSKILCKGQRLNNTKMERMGEVYGEDNRLCWKIIDPMPRLVVRERKEERKNEN